MDDPLERLENAISEELGVTVTLFEVRGTLVLMEIERVSGAPGSGKLALERLCAYADEVGKPVQLSVGAFERKLNDLYESVGFEVIPPEGEDDGGVNMLRTPREPAPEAGATFGR